MTLKNLDYLYGLNKMKFDFLPHTADIKFRAFGETLEECFKNAAYALTNIVVKEKIKPVIKKKIRVKAKKIESLLYDFLSEIIYHLDADDFLLSKISKLEIIGLSGKKRHYELIADLEGDNVKNYKTELIVKAITYSEMFIKQENGKFTCQIVVDV